MSEGKKYGEDALFIFPLIADGANDFVGDYTPAAGDCKLWTDTQISANTTSFILGFDSMSERPNVGDQINENGAGTGEAVVMAVVIISGTVGGGTAAGFMFVRGVAGQAWSNDDQIDINGGTADVATADSTTYDLAATAGLIGIIGNGLFAVALTPTEVTTQQGEIHIVDSATKAIEDQAIRFHTFGNASALHAVDFNDAVRGGMTALPNAAADAAGGLAISDAGGLDLDTKLANTNEITVARMGALTDWINAGRLDLILDAIQGTVNNVESGVSIIIQDTNELQVDWTNGGRLDLILDAIKVPTDKMVFTVANKLDSNMTHLLGVAAKMFSQYIGSDGPGIFVDSSAANTSTTLGVDGTEDNPVSTFAASRTLADALGVKVYYLEGNADVTLAATHVDWEFIGLGSVKDNIVNLGSQDVSRSLFRNLTLEGTQGGAGRITVRDCALQDPGAGTTTFHIFAERCGIVDDILIDTSADNVFDACFSLSPSGVSPIITATGASGSIIISHWGGKLELKSLSASHNIELDGNGHITFNADCNVNANLAIHGVWNVTDNTAGMSDLATMIGLVNMTKINAEVVDALATDTYAEPGDEAPAATASLATKISYNYKFSRNKIETTATKIHVYDDAGTNKDQTSTISDDATTFTRGEFGAGDA